MCSFKLHDCKTESFTKQGNVSRFCQLVIYGVAGIPHKQ